MQRQTSDPQQRSPRRQFLKSAGAMAAGLYLTGSEPLAVSQEPAAAAGGKPALLGGTPVRTKPFPAWPVMDQREDNSLLEVLHSGKWFRGGGQRVNRFEAAYARLTGAKHCVATANGTGALLASLALWTSGRATK